jgi:hypothetical protein
MDSIAWGELATKGFVVVRSFLSPAEVQLLADDFAAGRPASNQNYAIKQLGPAMLDRFRARLGAVADEVRAHGVRVDLVTSGCYFATDLGINASWHQDHESYFVFQEHYHYLNFWIPVIKPDAARSNLSLVPFDALLTRSKAAHDRLHGGGASHALNASGQTVLLLDERGERLPVGFDLDEIGVSPEVAPGDLVLLRGDVLHRTQDNDTPRVAVSFRMSDSCAVIRKNRLLSGGPEKRKMMRKNRGDYLLVLDCLNRSPRRETTAGELIAHLRRPRNWLGIA